MLGWDVLRLASAIIVSALVFSASGAVSLAMDEPCTTQAPAPDDGACPPTCVTCGCCAHAAEPVALSVPEAPDVPIATITHVLPSVPRTAPHDILHVPKTRIA